MENSSGKEDIAKASSVSLDNTDIGSSINNTTFEHDSQSSSTPKANRNLTFMTLPAEIRLKIYDLLLVSRANRDPEYPLAVQNSITMNDYRSRDHRAIEPAILRTCKQIYYEAVPILYTRNAFNISSPEYLMAYLTKIGLDNTTLIRALWSFEDGFPWSFEMRPGEQGLGDNVLFARALASLKQLDKLRIRGIYAKNWPAYFEKEMGIPVEAEYIPPVLSYTNKARARKYEEFASKWLKLYQEGTEHLFP